MAKISTSLFDISYMDTLSCLNTPIHRLDPRIKLIVTFFFVLTVVSFDKYEISSMIPFMLCLVVVAALANLPAAYLIKKICIVSPFAIMVAIFNPLLDHTIMMRIGTINISAGWVSFASIMIRFVLTVGAALVLISCTGFVTLCAAAEKIGLPHIFATQLLFLYRYLFVLIDEASRMVIARSLRSFHGRKMGLPVFTSMLGQLLLRTLERAQRIHHAMLCRGFEGEIRIMRSWSVGIPEIGCLVGCCVLFLTIRLYNIPQLVGKIITGLL